MSFLEGNLNDLKHDGHRNMALNPNIDTTLDSNKAHGYDMLNIRMLKLCGKSICKPLNLIFQSRIKHGEFPSEWKKANVVPVHKKSDKQILKNY